MVRNKIPTIFCDDPDGRTADIAHSGDGGPIGAAMFFTPEELIELGINPTTAEAVELRIVEGEVRLIPIKSSQNKEHSPQ